MFTWNSHSEIDIHLSASLPSVSTISGSDETPLFEVGYMWPNYGLPYGVLEWRRIKARKAKFEKMLQTGVALGIGMNEVKQAE